MHVLGIPQKALPDLTNRPDSLKHMQYFDAHNSN